MNKTFNINLGGYPFAIDEDAYVYIQNYLATIRRHFSASEGCEEILYDIEVRMAELFQEHLKGRAIISMKEIDEVIMIMGKPEDFGAEPMTESFHSGSKGKKFDTKIKTGKRLFRDPDDKKVGGVCSGIAAYFGIEDPLWIRLIFALLIFSGIGAVTYIVLWALIPEASSAGDKLSMRGEPATINNIAKIVEEELSDLGEKINEWSKDISGKKKSGDSEGKNGFYAKAALAKGVNVFGHVASGIIPLIRNVVRPIFLTISIIVLSALGIAWAASFVGISFASPVLHAIGPDSALLGYLGVGSLFFTFGLPILGAMLLIARLAFSYRINKNLKTGLWTGWFLSLFTTMFAGMSTIKEYKSHHEFTTVTDYNIEAQDIKIGMPEEDLDHSMGVFVDKFIADKDDKWAVRDVNLKVEKSKDNLVHIEKRISSRGEAQKDAQQNTLYVGNDVQVNGNEIQISKYLTIPKNRKFRNQSIDYTIYIPEGKNIILENNIKGRLHSSDLINIDQIYSDIDGLKWTVKGKGVFSEIYNDYHNHKKEVSTGNYNKIIIGENFNVTIKKGDKSNVTFNGNKELVEKIRYKNLDGTLTIDGDEDGDFRELSIIIESPSLELIHLNGIKSASIEGFNQDNLKIFAKDSNRSRHDAEIKFSGNIKNMDISLEGNQNLTLIGTGEAMSAVLNNGANINAEKFIVNNATISGDHTHESSFYIQKQLHCDSPEHVDFKVYGNPAVSKL
ncbi:MAG: PspC domain-containing protein [Saprospiraceae bacterium]|jgi:phage shock protein PspC (stress-responsive transcriptional regulator)|nr:PspC domain-containing protein [Saprospiraceae bacterium]